MNMLLAFTSYNIQPFLFPCIRVQSSVYMEDSLRRMAAMGLDALVEIGPGKALSGFVKKTVPELPVYAVETAAELEQLTETLKGASL